MKAVILAGGLGARLKSTLNDLYHEDKAPWKVW